MVTLPANWVPILEFDFDANFTGGLWLVTCRNHPTARYLTKHPRIRSLHFTKAADGFPAFSECPCPYEDLVVVIDEVDD